MSSYYDYTESWWEEIQAPSEDEKAIIQYLMDYDLSGYDVLHVGVGNNFVARAFPSARMTGLTISIFEYQKAVSIKLPAYLPILIDKHDPALDKMLNMYDIIIDNNIGSYSPDFESGCEFLRVALNHLRPNGYLITHLDGLSYKNPFDLKKALKVLGSIREILNGPNGVVIIQ